MIKFLKSIFNPFPEIEKAMTEIWPKHEMQRLARAFERHGLEPIQAGSYDWLKRINDLIELIEAKHK